MKVPLLDLKAQYAGLRDEIEPVMREIFESQYFIMGPAVKECEAAVAEYCRTGHAVGVSSGTDALLIALMAEGIGPGDEVITPSLTWVSTVNMIALAGATPVFADVDRDTLMVSAKDVEAAITPKTRAIVPVHYAGAPLDLDPLREVAKRHALPLVEDAAHAVGTRYRDEWVGRKGTAIFSFHAIKNVTCAEGGLVATDDEALAERVRCLKFHGLGVDAFDRERQGRKPQAEVVEPGWKYNLSDLHAALAVTQLARLPKLNARRKVLAGRYLKALAGSPFLPLGLPAYPHEHAWHLFMIRVDKERCGLDRDALMERLKAVNIGTGLHFRAAHTQKYYRERYPKLVLPNTEWNSARLCTLPLFPDMTEADVDRVVEALFAILRNPHA